MADIARQFREWYAAWGFWGTTSAAFNVELYNNPHPLDCGYGGKDGLIGNKPVKLKITIVRED